MRAAVSRSNCCSRASSSSISGSDPRARLLPLVGSVFVVVPIDQLLLVKCSIDSRLNAANGGGSRNERGLRLLLNHIQQRVQLIDPVFRRSDRLLEALVERGDRLAHLLYIDTNGRRDIVDVVRD